MEIKIAYRWKEEGLKSSLIYRLIIPCLRTLRLVEPMEILTEEEEPGDFDDSTESENMDSVDREYLEAVMKDWENHNIIS